MGEELILKKEKCMKKEVGMRMIWCLFLMCSMPLFEFSQEAKPKEKYRVNVLDDRSINIEFDTEKPIANVLILVVDSAGNTIFMDNQSNFKGSYKCNIDMKLYNKGTYDVKIKSDGEEIDKKLSLK